jgi:predicted nucleotidyltransferase
MSASDLRPYGLSPAQISAIQAVLQGHPEVERAILYGSRAKGNYRPGSDIDLTLQGKELDWSALAKIANDLDDLLLPYTIDLSIYHTLENAELISHIRRVGVNLYTRPSVSPAG